MLYTRLLKADTELFSTEYLGIYETEDGSYTYCKEIKTQNGTKVALLPFIVKDGQNYFLSVVEKFHPHLEAGPCAITGKIDLDGSPDVQETALKELHEEAGLLGEVKDLIYLGCVFPSKSMDTKFECFAVNIKDVEVGEAIGDGSVEEEEAYTKWIPQSEINNLMVDPTFYFMVYSVLTRKK